jgi:hypothetical protein
LFPDPNQLLASGFEGTSSTGAKRRVRTLTPRAKIRVIRDGNSIKGYKYQAAGVNPRREGACGCSTTETTGLKHRRQPDVLPHVKSLLGAKGQ